MGVQQLKNYVQTTLASGCTSGATTISVVSASGLPTAGNFMLRIDDPAPATTFEYVECTGVSGTTLTVTRGQEGTTGIAHSAGAFVGNDLTAGMLSRGYIQKDYKFHASMSAAFSLTASTWATLPLALASAFGTDFDPNSNFDAVTTHLWTVPVTGYYVVVATVQISSTTGSIGARFLKNGTTALAQNVNGQVSTGTAHTSDILSLTAGDTIALQGFETSGTGSFTVTASLAAHFLSVP